MASGDVALEVVVTISAQDDEAGHTATSFTGAAPTVPASGVSLENSTGFPVSVLRTVHAVSGHHDPILDQDKTYTLTLTEV